MKEIFLDSSIIHEISITDDDKTNIMLKNGDQVVVDSSVILIGKGTTTIRRFE